MNRLQRQVIVVALGAVLIVIGLVINQTWNTPPSDGWFMYTPGTDTPFHPASAASFRLRRALVWLVVFAAWTVAAWRIHRSSDNA